jgi:hypothetical protein
MCERLGIRIIAAHSPQAKGRVERNNGTQQDRLVKKLRRKGIATHTKANEYIEAEYLAEHNRRFAGAPREVEDYHGKAPVKRELDAIFRLETERTIGNDWVLRYQGMLLQLKPQNRSYGPTRAKAIVCQGEDGQIQVRYRDQTIAHEQIQEREQRVPPAAETERKQTAKRSSGLQWNGAGQHPWKQSYAEMKVRSKMHEIG